MEATAWARIRETARTYQILEGLPPRVRGRVRPLLTEGAKECLHRSVLIARSRRDRVITRDHILAAVASGGERDPAVTLLRRLEIDPQQVEADALNRLEGEPS